MHKILFVKARSAITTLQPYIANHVMIMNLRERSTNKIGTYLIGRFDKQLVDADALSTSPNITNVVRFGYMKQSDLLSIYGCSEIELEENEEIYKDGNQFSPNILTTYYSQDLYDKSVLENILLTTDKITSLTENISLISRTELMSRYDTSLLSPINVMSLGIEPMKQNDEQKYSVVPIPLFLYQIIQIGAIICYLVKIEGFVDNEQPDNPGGNGTGSSS